MRTLVEQLAKTANLEQKGVDTLLGLSKKTIDLVEEAGVATCSLSILCSNNMSDIVSPEPQETASFSLVMTHVPSLDHYLFSIIFIMRQKLT